MLTEEEVTKLACTMVLLDITDTYLDDSFKTEELVAANKDLRAAVSSIWETLDDDEKNQTLERYKQERNSGEITSLPPL